MVERGRCTRQAVCAPSQDWQGWAARRRDRGHEESFPRRNEKSDHDTPSTGRFESARQPHVPMQQTTSASPEHIWAVPRRISGEIDRAKTIFELLVRNVAYYSGVLSAVSDTKSAVIVRFQGRSIRVEGRRGRFNGRSGGHRCARWVWLLANLRLLVGKYVRFW